jgi:hypothetical protein
LDQIIKSTGDVIKYEREAIEAAKIMEEASIKAHIAKENMMNVIYKLIGFYFYLYICIFLDE